MATITTSTTFANAIHLFFFLYHNNYAGLTHFVPFLYFSSFTFATLFAIFVALRRHPVVLLCHLLMHVPLWQLILVLFVALCCNFIIYCIFMHYFVIDCFYCYRCRRLSNSIYIFCMYKYVHIDSMCSSFFFISSYGSTYLLHVVVNTTCYSLFQCRIELFQGECGAHNDDSNSN